MNDVPRATPRELILGAPALIEELRQYKIGAHDGPPLHPVICDRAADVLEKFLALGQVMMAGRQAWVMQNEHGKTLLDFFNVWLDHAEDRNAKLQSEVESLKAAIRAQHR